jgi:D-amino-acid dehydrogenase
VSDHLLYAFGHGHLGLTQAATTGEMIGALLAGDPPHVALDPYSIGRF